MSIKDLKDEISEEVATILGKDFKITVTNTDNVPHSGDSAITFPNLDAKTQGTKLIDTCVLYIDIRRSTELNLTHKPQTVAKLYSAFVRAMTRCARYHKGHVRGIIGDRVMVLFDKSNCFVNAVECAFSMNSVAKYVIDKHFKANEVTCGIGIDTGKMLATKTGVRRHGAEQANYRNLVWLGRPANVASKLTDLANKAGEDFTIPIVHVATEQMSLYTNDWKWTEYFPSDFVRKLDVPVGSRQIQYSDPAFVTMFAEDRTFTRRPATDPILMTEAVWNGYKAAAPTANAVTKGWFKAVDISVPGYTGKVYGGDVHYVAFKS